MKTYSAFLFLFILVIVILPGCSYFQGNELNNIGMLFDSTIEDNSWNEKGYEALLEMEKQFKTDVFYKENVRSEQEVKTAVADFVKEGVNLVIGHGNSYGNHFVDLTKTYPEVHFIYTNGEIYDSGITSINMNVHALGFFAGMVAGEMTKSDQIGVIAAYSWQPELEGLYEGAKYQNPNSNLMIDFLTDWDDVEQALAVYEKSKTNGADIIIPIGHAYSKAVIEAAADDGIHSIGYIQDQHEIAPDYVLTSMIQHIDHLYIKAATDFNNGDLVGGIRSYDIHEDYIKLGEFNEKIPEYFRTYIQEEIENYKETNLLPYEH